MLYGDCEFFLMKKVNLKIGLIFILIGVLLVIFRALMFPYSETMTCGADYVCHVEQKFLWKTQEQKIRLHYLYSYVNFDIVMILIELPSIVYI